MGKKYVPSGYQIISIELSDGSIIDSEDKEILRDIITNRKLYNKPILIDITDLDNDSGICGFVTFNNYDIVVSSFGLSGKTANPIVYVIKDDLTYQTNQ